jgi:V/A-type H+-transporting ATPase subunit F
MEIAVIGNDEFVTGFSLAGVKNTFSTEENLEKEVEKVLQLKEIGILIMEQDQFNSMNNKTKKMLEKLVKPVLVTIYDKGKETDIRDMIKRTIGVDLWK